MLHLWPLIGCGLLEGRARTYDHCSKPVLAPHGAQLTWWEILMNKGKLEMPISYRARKSTSQEDRRGHLCLSASPAWHLLPGLTVSPPAPVAGPLRTPPGASNSLCQGRAFPKPHPHVPPYLELEFPILKKPQLILTVQIVSINVAQVYLRSERGSTQVIGRSCPTGNTLHVLS